MRDFHKVIQSTLKECYDNYRSDKQRLTDNLQKMYRRAFYRKSSSCGNELVPFSARCLKDEPVREGKYVYKLEYNFPEATDANKYPEFTGHIEENAELKEGDIIDRIGSTFGNYASPVPKRRWIYSASERAIPYLFLAEKLDKEPSYHKYRVIKPISRSNLLEAINASTELEEAEKNFMREEIEDSTIVYGDVARVEAFDDQGDGGGKQYSFCVKIEYLIQLKFIKEEKK